MQSQKDFTSKKIVYKDKQICYGKLNRIKNEKYLRCRTISQISEYLDSGFEGFWTPSRADRGPKNLVSSVRPYIRPQRAFLENASFNFSKTWHEVRVP